MNAIDITSLVILGYFCIKGYMSGFVRAILSLVGVVVASIASYLFNSELLPLLSPNIQQIDGINVFGPVVLFLAIMLAFRVLSAMLTRSLRHLSLSTLNRVLGGLFCLLKASLLLALILYFVLLLFTTLQEPLPEVLQDAITYRVYFSLRDTYM